MEFLKLIYLSLIKKPKKKEEASFPISLECFVFFFPLDNFAHQSSATHTVKATLKLSHGHTESAERTW